MRLAKRTSLSKRSSICLPNTVERIRYPLRYKAIVTGAKYVPMGLLQRLQKLGRD